MNSWYQSALFAGLLIQCPSSGKYTIFDGTPRRCSVVKSCSPSPIGTRKSSSPCVTSVGVLKFFA